MIGSSSSDSDRDQSKKDSSDSSDSKHKTNSEEESKQCSDGMTVKSNIVKNDISEDDNSGKQILICFETSNYRILYIFWKLSIIINHILDFSSLSLG